VTDKLRVAIAGLGTVGVGVVKILETHKKLIADRAGREIEVVAVSASNRTKDRGVDISGYEWFDNSADFAASDNIDLVVELIGGSDGIAKTVAENTLKAGKAFVTANKALIAHHGAALADIANENNVALRYEAAVAGGIPIIKAIGEGLAANKFSKIYGIINGTTNYMLSQMERTGKSYDEILEETEQLGYLEADPSLDLDGIDAAHKLAILSSVAFGVKTDFENVYIEGIRKITTRDIGYAKELGYRIKLIATTTYEDGALKQRVHPAFVSLEEPIASVMDGFNAVVAEGNFVDKCFFQGRGAGEGPTASAVVADLIDIARGHRDPAFFIPASKLITARPVSMDDHISSYYIKLHVAEEAGVIADITAALKRQGVSIEQMLQKGSEEDGTVYVILVTHEVKEAALKAALAGINNLISTLNDALAIRIENL
jgi:homoserine dehydrogenase